MSGHVSGRTGVLADPNFRRERARMGGTARTSIDYYINKLVEAAARLTDDQRDRIAVALRGGGQ